MRGSLVSLGSFVVLVACGGGGGGSAPPLAAAVDVQLDGFALGATEQEGLLTVRLGPLPDGARPVLLQGDLEVASGGVRIVTASSPLEAVQPVATLDGQPAGTAYRVVCGDGSTTAGAPLAAGPLFRVRVQAVSPRTPGPATVRLANLRVVDAAGSVLPLAAPAATAQVTVN